MPLFNFHLLKKRQQRPFKILKSPLLLEVFPAPGFLLSPPEEPVLSACVLLTLQANQPHSRPQGAVFTIRSLAPHTHHPLSYVQIAFPVGQYPHSFLSLTQNPFCTPAQLRLFSFLQLFDFLFLPITSSWLGWGHFFKVNNHFSRVAASAGGSGEYPIWAEFRC